MLGVQLYGAAQVEVFKEFGLGTLLRTGQRTQVLRGLAVLLPTQRGLAHAAVSMLSLIECA